MFGFFNMLHKSLEFDYFLHGIYLWVYLKVHVYFSIEDIHLVIRIIEL